MYTVLSAYGVSKKPQSRWGLVDITGLTINEIFNSYREIYFTITANFLTEPVIVNLEVFRLKYSAFLGTPDEMFTDNGTESFPLTDALPLKKTGFAKYADAFASGYSIQIKARNSSVESDVLRSEKTDLILHRSDPVTNMGVVYKKCMVNVNGYYHLTDTDSKFLYVYDGGKSAEISKRNAIGLLSFEEIGDIQNVPITESMIYTQTRNSELYEKVYIKIPKDTENKSVLLVLGGYLVLPEPGVFSPIGNNSFCINLNKLPLLERYFESLKYIDLSTLGLSTSGNNPSAISISEFYNSSAIFKYLTLSQSFFVIVDTPEIFVNKTHIEQTGLPGIYESLLKPTYPLMLGRGKVGNYVYDVHDGVYRLCVNDPYLARRVFNNLPTSNRDRVCDSYPTVDGNIKSRAYMMEIGSDFVPV